MLKEQIVKPTITTKTIGGIKMITLYTKKDCSNCDKTREYLKKENITFSEVDVETDEYAVKMLDLYGYVSLPVIAVDGFDNSWCGFVAERMDELRGAS